MIDKKPSKKEVKEVLARAEKIAKSEERIFDNPTLKKAKNIGQDEKKGSPAGSPDKLDILLDKVEGLVKRQDRLEEIYTKGAVTATPGPSSEKKVIDQRNKGGKTSEQLLAEAQAEQDKTTGQDQAGQPQGQLTPEQYEKLPDSEKVKLLEAQLKQGGQPQSPGKLTGQQALYGLIEIIKATGPTIQTAIAKGGNSDNPAKSFLEQMKVYQNIENTVLGGFFNFMKNLSPQQRQNTMSNIITSPSTPTVGDLSSKSEIIK